MIPGRSLPQQPKQVRVIHFILIIAKYCALKMLNYGGGIMNDYI